MVTCQKLNSINALLSPPAIGVTRLCVSALLRAVVGECFPLGLVCLLCGASDVVVDELLGCGRQGRGLLMDVLLVLSA